MLKRSKLIVLAVLLFITLFMLIACVEATENPFGTTTPVPEVESATTDKNDAVTSNTKIENGKSKFKGLGCSGCHKTDSGKLVGPGLAGIGAKGDDYIRTSIVDPAAEIVDGYNNLMPTSFASLKSSELDDLVAYLKTLN